ncbi:MAG: alpha/beta hydrolase, partial [Casimicrobium sp.]
WARPQGLPITVFPGAGHFFHGRLTELKTCVKRGCAHIGASA